MEGLTYAPSSKWCWLREEVYVKLEECRINIVADAIKLSFSILELPLDIG